jgi:hypothetical protein
MVSPSIEGELGELAFTFVANAEFLSEGDACTEGEETEFDGELLESVLLADLFSAEILSAIDEDLVEDLSTGDLGGGELVLLIPLLNIAIFSLTDIFNF